MLNAFRLFLIFETAAEIERIKNLPPAVPKFVLPILTSASSRVDWNNQSRLRQLARHLGCGAGGTNLMIKERVSQIQKSGKSSEQM